jgi:cobalamin biosynthesis protein CobD/CbiB
MKNLLQRIVGACFVLAGVAGVVYVLYTIAWQLAVVVGAVAAVLFGMTVYGSSRLDRMVEDVETRLKG